MAELRVIDTVTARCLEFIILTAARSKQARSAKFQDIDADGIWRVPAPEMKGGLEHTVPLCSRALEIIEWSKGLPPSELIFPHPDSRKMLSVNATRALLIRMGRKGITTHGWRATFKTWATAQTNFQREVIEMAMAHKVGDEAEQAYLRETAHAKRRLLMQDWSNYCLEKETGEIVRLHGTNT